MKKSAKHGTKTLMTALVALAVLMTWSPTTAAVVEGPEAPTVDDLHHKDAPNHVGQCAEDWTLVETLGNGATATFFFWVEQQTLKQVLQKDTIDMMITWNHQKAAKSNDYQIRYHSTAWEPLMTMFGLQPAPSRLVGYSNLWAAGDCAGLRFDTGASHLGKGGEVTAEIIYEDVVMTWTDNTQWGVLATNMWESSMETAVTSKITAKINGDIGGEVGGEIRTQRTMGASETHTYEEGITVMFTPTLWAGVFGAHVGGGGLMGWLDEETGGVVPGGDPVPPYHLTWPGDKQIDEVKEACPSPPEECALL